MSKSIPTKSKKNMNLAPDGSKQYQRTLKNYFTSISSKKIGPGGDNRLPKSNADENMVKDCRENVTTSVIPISSHEIKQPQSAPEALKEKPLIPQRDISQTNSPVKKKIKLDSDADNKCTQNQSLEKEVRWQQVEAELKEVASLMDDMSDLEFFSEDEIESSGDKLKISAEELDLSSIQRCIVFSVEAGPTGTKLVQLSSFSNKDLTATCSISGSWAWESDLSESSIINVRALKTSGQWMVFDDPSDYCMLVEEPDLLLSCTTVMSALRCRRAAVLSELFKGLGMEDRGGYLALGKLMHEVTQQCLSEKVQSQYSVEQIFESLLKNPRIIFDLYSMQNDLVKLREAAQPYFSSIAKFLEQHASPGNFLSSDLLSESSKRGSDVWPGKIHEITDIEDTIWMPQFGLKGKLDLTGSVKHQKNMNNHYDVPLELKTGRMDTDQVSHRGQLILYTAMMAEADKKPVEHGLLVYLKGCAVKEVRANSGEIRDAIILRNELAKAIRGRPEILVDDESNPEKKYLKPAKLPAPIKRPRECVRCPYFEVCTAYSTKEDYHSPVQQERLKERKENLTESHINYFIHWVCLTQLEEQDCVVNLEALWTKSPSERELEKKGCISDLDIKSCVKDDLQFITTLVRSENAKCNGNLCSAGLRAGDFVVFGNKQRIVLSLGTIRSVTNDSVELVVDKDFSKRYGTKNYSLDMYKSNKMLTTKLVSLASLLADDDNAFKLRQLVIDRIEPKFVEADFSHLFKTIPDVLEKLNDDQKLCVQKVLEAQDYVLIQGLPGSGKTFTIVALIRILATLGFSVLVTSHTNSAVDNVLCRLLPFNLNILRLGASSKFAPGLKEHTEAALTAKASNISELELLLQEKSIIGVTCTSANHPVLKRRLFDYCIIDEATQVPQPSAISALLRAKRFVLVGDPAQLQPVVTNKDAKALGMEETIFERLQTTQNTAILGLQYRMNASICDLANKITYKGALKCGNDKVAKSTFKLPNPAVLEAAKSWVRKVLCHHNGVVFLDTGKTKIGTNPEDKSEDVSNLKEANLVTAIVNTMIKGGISSQDIGVMTPFRRQVAVISSCMPIDDLDISTVDQFQGKDKEVCLISFAKSFDENSDNVKRGGILTDFKRLTVAITRARVKLILVGDFTSLVCFEPLQKLKDAIGENNIVSLDQKADF
ncbi:DNA replication ATP-dependent helicase/nuclease DNA2 [Cloeon dipterum]|uniref:DNA replication ATP-dependent helicase/nuclease DNA2 n=1 Tax=Cloeon dipterum TaxID=197152 RepID=UPI003220610E